MVNIELIETLLPEITPEQLTFISQLPDRGYIIRYTERKDGKTTFLICIALALAADEDPKSVNYYAGTLVQANKATELARERVGLLPLTHAEQTEILSRVNFYRSNLEAQSYQNHEADVCIVDEPKLVERKVHNILKNNYRCRIQIGTPKPVLMTNFGVRDKILSEV